MTTLLRQLLDNSQRKDQRKVKSESRNQRKAKSESRDQSRTKSKAGSRNEAKSGSESKKVLLPIISAEDLRTVPPELLGAFNLIFYNSAEDAVFKALGVE